MADLRFEFRPIGAWTDPETPARQGSNSFKASWESTLELLGYEAEQLGAELVVVQIDVQEGDLRRDGALKARARVGHPGAAVSFASKFGPLRYATDRYEPRWSGDPPGWQANVRAVALALQSLRAVDRYAVTRRGEQYTGWSALPAARPGSSSLFDDPESAQTWMRKCAAENGIGRVDDIGWGGLYRMLAKEMHPDKTGGSTELWDRLESLTAESLTWDDLLSGAAPLPPQPRAALRITGGIPWLVQSYRDSGEIPPDLAERAADAISAVEGRLILEDLDHPLSLLRPYLARIAGRQA